MTTVLLIIITVLLLIIILSNKKATETLYVLIAYISFIGLVLLIIGLIVGALILFYFLDIDFKIAILSIPFFLGALFLIGFATFFSAEKLSKVSDNAYDKLKIKIHYRPYLTALVWVVTIVCIFFLIRFIFN